ncbi:helix-turn-helix domain-containing protein [Microbacterium sp. 13-71-7]|jgi:predicted DNA-binding transcriptional regulator AlpA|uniref:helix-turn-helix transcriptional regulator n=1 Tax=Microbacterium sp. 13-71-7 TaxID=1970399 RepID=UPI000BC3B013|nr:MAG: hypothetical protein B7X32_16685 [Microbacterium sp. 13-71-7]
MTDRDRLLAELVDLIAVRTAENVIRALEAREIGPTPSTSALAPILLNTKAAAAMLGMSPQSLRNLRSAQQGPLAVKRGASVRYRPADLEAWAAAEFKPA